MSQITQISKSLSDDRERQKNTHAAIYNPVTSKVYVEDRHYGNLEKQGARGEFDWSRHPWVTDVNVFADSMVKLKGGSINKDQAQYRWINDEFLDDAYDYYNPKDKHGNKLYGAGLLTSTEFPAFTTIATETQVVNLERLARMKFNLLQTVRTLNVDQLYVRFPIWNDSTKNVKVGYQENDPIDTVNWGALTESQITIEKAGVGWGATEEYDMQRFNTINVEQLMLEKIGFEFTERRHEQLAAGLSSFGTVSGSDWAAYTAGNLQSDNRPQTSLNSARTAIINTRRYSPSIIITNMQQWIDYDTNTWTKDFGGTTNANTQNIDATIANPRGIPWCDRWYINEDIANDIAYVIDPTVLLMVEGPSKTTAGQLINPDQRVQFRKEWFRFYIFDATGGKKVTGI